MKLRPTRAKAENESDGQVMIDLDKLISEPQAFRWRGKKHLIKPISTSLFFQATAKLVEIDKLRMSEAMTEEEFVKRYADLFSIVCETIDKGDVKEMTNSQRGALMQLILDCMRGRAQSELYGGEKKKSLEAVDPQA